MNDDQFTSVRCDAHQIESLTASPYEDLPLPFPWTAFLIGCVIVAVAIVFI
jgi:hypothetical protein